jgi:glycogen synthase
MNVLMFGWEFPPLNSGGLGTACFGLSKGLSRAGVRVTFVLPRTSDAAYSFLRVIAAGVPTLTLRGIKTALAGYATSSSYETKVFQLRRTEKGPAIYGGNLFEEVERYAGRAADIAREEQHDIIHAHEWLTFEAGIAAKKASGKPLVVHVHATEFDRTGGLGVNKKVYDIEKKGMEAADAVIAVSNYTKNKILAHYGIPSEKVHVVHNAIESGGPTPAVSKTGKTVLYLGRMTLQKGPDYFLEAARKVLEVEPDARFIMTGAGDMEDAMMRKADALGISDRVLFTGFLRDKDLAKAYALADLYVMPSVSEPFGLTPLEAAIHGTPVLVSRQSGVSEVFSNCLKVDFWDIHEMANKIVSVLRHPALQASLSTNALAEISRMNWDIPAGKCVNIYERLGG